MQSLPASLLRQCQIPKKFDLGIYYRWGSGADRKQRFLVELDAAPLFVLVQEAVLSYRVYELLTITGPNPNFKTEC